MEEKEEEKLVCPHCQQGTIVKGKTAWGCTNFQHCSLRIPFSFMNKELTDSQVKQLIVKGKTSRIKGFETSDGVKTDGKIQFSENFELKLA
jgi:DNA topoisomerase III